MPELPEVETIVRGLRDNILNLPIQSTEVRWPGIVVFNKDPQKLLDKDRISSIDRHGKYIKITTKKGTRLVVHLRMTGQLFITDQTYEPDKHVHLILEFTNGKRLVYRDIRKFGRWIIVPANKEFEDFINAGIDALDIDTKELIKLINKNTSRKLKAFLLDQTLLAGIGNIYADEICFALKLNPETPVKKVNPIKLKTAIQHILKLAIRHKGTSVSDYITSTAAKGNFQNLLKVYKQVKCANCGKPIKHKKVAGRTSHYCPSCQRI